MFQSANELVKRIKSKIHLLHVLPGDSTQEHVRITEDKLEKVPEKLKVNGSVCLKVLKGEISERILLYASGLSNPVIFISHTSGQFRVPNYTGPNAESIIANSPFPVFLLKKGLQFVNIKTILLSVDIEKQNRIKLNHAVFLSKFFNNALIRLVHVEFDLEDRRLKKLAVRMEHYRTFFHKRGVACYGEIVSANSKNEETKSEIVVDYADKSRAELMLIATNEEKSPSNYRISDDAFYILSHFRNNIFSITPFVAGAGKLISE